MGRFVGQAIGGGEVFKLKTRAARLMVRPFDTLGAQRAAEAQHIDNIPARVAIFPLPLIGVIEISIEGIASHFIVKANAVVADATGVGPCHLLMDGIDKLRLGKTFLERVLGGNTCD